MTLLQAYFADDDITEQMMNALLFMQISTAFDTARDYLLEARETYSSVSLYYARQYTIEFSELISKNKAHINPDFFEQAMAARDALILLFWRIHHEANTTN